MKVFITFLLLLPLALFAQDGKFMEVMPMIGGKVHYSEVVKVDSSTADELYNRAKQYFINAYRSANDVIQLDDREQRTIIGKGYFTDYWQYPMNVQEINVYHTLTISCKDGRYKVDITDFNFRYYQKGTAYTSGSNADYPMEEFDQKYFKKSSKKTIVRIDGKVSAMLNEIREAMSKLVVSAKNDW